MGKRRASKKKVTEKHDCDHHFHFDFFIISKRLFESISSPSRVADTTSPACSFGVPWVCVANPGESEQRVTPSPGPGLVPSISLQEPPPPTSLQPEAGDSCDREYDDGPEYLAIGNLGQRARRDSQSSTHSSDQHETQEQSVSLSLQRGSLALPPPRRSSFSEGQRGPGRGSHGHTRSFSDTGINQKLRNGKQTGGNARLSLY